MAEVEISPAALIVAEDNLNGELLSETHTLFEEVYARVHKTIRFKKLNVSDLMYIATDAMQIVAKYPELTGEDKKRLVIEVIYSVVDQSDVFEGETEERALIWIREELPKFIDLMYGAYIQIYDFAKQTVTKCKAGCIARREAKK